MEYFYNYKISAWHHDNNAFDEHGVSVDKWTLRGSYKCDLQPVNEKQVNMSLGKTDVEGPGIIISITFTSSLADSDIEKIFTLIAGAFVWGVWYLDANQIEKNFKRNRIINRYLCF